MTLTRFGETNRHIKLCNNNAEDSRYQEGYYPVLKVYLLYKDLVAKIKSISDKYY